MARICAVSELPDDAELEYVQGLRAAVRAAIEYAIDVVEFGEERSPPIPAVLLAQTRLLATQTKTLQGSASITSTT